MVKKDAYIHRKILIDSLYGELNVRTFANVAKLYTGEKFKVDMEEIKGLQISYGSLKLPQNEFFKAKKFKENYGLIVISNLADVPKMISVFGPADKLDLTKQTVVNKHITYHTKAINW